jgi:hypothetical protein
VARSKTAKKSPARARPRRANEEASALAGAPPKNPRCKAKTARGKPCRGRAVTGSDLCVAHLRRNGRRSTLTDDITERITAVLRSGGYVQAAASAASVPVRTYNHWLERGDPEGSDPKDEPYRVFREKVERAVAEGEAVNVALISRAAQKDWKAAAWLLERRHPDRWAGPRGRSLNSSIHPDDFAAGEMSSGPDVVDDQVGPDGRPI